MEWKLSGEQESYQQTLREWLVAVAGPEPVRAWFEAADPGPFNQRLLGDGWWGVGVTEDAGGQGGGVVELALTAEELGRAAAPSAAWLSSVLTVPATGRWGDTPSCWLTPAEGPPRVVDVAVDGDGLLTGTVPRVLGASSATSFVVAVRGASAVELRLVDDSDAVTIDLRKLLDRSRDVADVTLRGARSTLLEAGADAALADAASLSAVLVAADALGASQRMLDMTVAYSLQRRQFGVPIGSFQAVKHTAATMEVMVEASRSAVYFAAASIEGSDVDSRLHAAAVKAQVTADASIAADAALTVHGAIGYTWEYDLQLFYKRAKLDEYLCGDPHWWNEQIAIGLALA
ncbi:acyl-CoA dehydrogenase family protein [Nocardioides halotolerans]|jgi:alkylation response protein AidB-like acyl-CoA dehydrogenase|uniref:acyl-CoA dehydrogenase family protein n=1 Tax=Nocardioides halotolerans TaxID=433660 RepID=UPI000426955A|nr:acyl-CoA dehydrogenase family protein [Nocardioides halotolerans]